MYWWIAALINCGMVRYFFLVPLRFCSGLTRRFHDGNRRVCQRSESDGRSRKEDLRKVGNKMMQTTRSDGGREQDEASGGKKLKVQGAVGGRWVWNLQGRVSITQDASPSSTKLWDQTSTYIFTSYWQLQGLWVRSREATQSPSHLPLRRTQPGQRQSSPSTSLTATKVVRLQKPEYSRRCGRARGE